MEVIEKELGPDATDEQIQALLEDVTANVNEMLVNYKKIKKTVLRKTEFEKNTSHKIKRY
jgi:long-chain acyl-CoA synthetase